ncbi:hypothetical protein [Microseira sp. BLCC-F43]|uniref:hypothetical protein n=1 Tax=Microseira sp. BLCC-F43 TaxID=3153602 RepID=UPI0035BC8973
MAKVVLRRLQGRAGRPPHKNCSGFVGWASCLPIPEELFWFCRMGILLAHPTRIVLVLSDGHPARPPHKNCSSFVGWASCPPTPQELF